MNMQEIKNKFDEGGLEIFHTNTPLTFWFWGKKEENLALALEVIDGNESEDCEIWESFYNNRW